MLSFLVPIWIWYHHYTWLHVSVFDSYFYTYFCCWSGCAYLILKKGSIQYMDVSSNFTLFLRVLLAARFIQANTNMALINLKFVIWISKINMYDKKRFFLKKKKKIYFILTITSKLMTNWMDGWSEKIVRLPSNL